MMRPTAKLYVLRAAWSLGLRSSWRKAASAALMYSPSAARGSRRSIRVALTIFVAAFASGPLLANGIKRGRLSLTLEYVAQLPRAHAVTTASANGRHRLSVRRVFILLKARRVSIHEAAPVDKESHRVPSS